MATEKKYVSLQKLGLYHEKEVARVNALLQNAAEAANNYADSLATNYDAAGSSATVQGKLDEEIARAKAAEAAALKAGQDAQSEVDALETYVGTIPETSTATDVVGLIIEKTAGIATDAALESLTNRVTQAENDIDAVEADYLKAADKAEMAQAVEAEANRAKGIEGGLETRLKAVEDDYLKAADKDELAGDISANADAIAAVKEDVDAFFKDADMTESAKDTLKELQEYIASDESGASAMAASIKANSDAIDAVEGRMDTAEGKITALEEADSAQDEKIAALEAKFGEGEGSVEDLIADAVAAEAALREAADAEVQADADKGIEDAAAALAAAQAAQSAADAAQGEVDALEQVVAGKAAQADLEALTGRVETAEGEIDTLQGEMDAVEALAAANKAAHEANAAAIALKADQTALQAEIERAQAAEKANADAIAAFVEVSEQEILDLFA